MSKQNLFIFSSNNKTKNEIIVVIAKVFLMLSIMLFIFWKYISPQYENGYNASIIDKVDRLETIDEPKIILVGNSSVAFGFRSELIEKAFGMPVVNVGIHGALGDEFDENIALNYVKNGDIVIEFPTFFNDDDTRMSSYPLAWITIEDNFKYWRFVPVREWNNMFLNYPIYLKKCIKLFNTDSEEIIKNEVGYGIYSRDAFNMYGDNEYAKYSDSTYEFPYDYYPIVPTIDNYRVKRINNISNMIKSKGAEFYIAPYPIACNEKEKYITQFDEFKVNLAGKVQCDIVGNYSDYLYPYDYFFDTSYHLTENGAIARTNQLICDLNKIIQ